MRLLPIILVLVAAVGCSREEKNDLSRATDERLSVYNDILDELVQNHFYDLYLGEDLEKLDAKFRFKRDSPAYRKELEILESLVLSDTARQSTICLKNEFIVIKSTQLGKEDFREAADLITGLSKHFGDSSTNLKGIYDSLASPQKQFTADHFHPLSYKVARKGCNIGIIVFSKISFSNFRDKGLLYYEFFCGEKCGKGEVLVIEKQGGQWTIQKSLRFWIS